MAKVTQLFEVDLVYLWVDGDDPVWLRKKEQYTGKVDNSELNSKARYINNDELKYSLRSVEKYVPWVRRICIVTDNQCPKWLNTDHPKIRIVDHTEILPAEALPCFNSSVIEYFLYKIPGLSEHFLFLNDDMFFNRVLSADYFFDNDGLPFIRLRKKILGRWHYLLKNFIRRRQGQYMSMVLEGAAFVEKNFGKYYAGIPHHNVDAYVKSDYKNAVEGVFSYQARESLSSRIRTYGDLHRSAFSYYALATNKGHLKYVGRRESSRIQVQKHNFQKYLNKYQPDLFCLNDSQRVRDKHRAKIKPFLQNILPEKSSFEK